MYALARLGIDARLVSDTDAIREVDQIILPEIGAAQATIDSLTESGSWMPCRDTMLHGHLQRAVLSVGVESHDRQQADTQGPRTSMRSIDW